MSTALVLARGDGVGRAGSWVALPDDERRRRAVAAARDHNVATLWDLTDAHLTLYGRAGGAVSPYTRRNYRQGVTALVMAWGQENLVRPRRDAGALWLRRMEDEGLKPSTVNVRLAGARALYAALRWTGATEADPLRDAHPAKDTVPAWEKRRPYAPEEVGRLIAAARGDDRALVLLGAHAGLRVSEMLGLRWDDVDAARRELVVRKGKGGKPRTVEMSATLTATLVDLAATGERVIGKRSGYVLPYGTGMSAWTRLNGVCVRAGVAALGVHSLRHAAGTRLVKETGSLEEAARHLGHASIETTRVYAKWSNTRLRETMNAW